MHLSRFTLDFTIVWCHIVETQTVLRISVSSVRQCGIRISVDLIYFTLWFIISKFNLYYLRVIECGMMMCLFIQSKISGSSLCCCGEWLLCCASSVMASGWDCGSLELSGTASKWLSGWEYFSGRPGLLWETADSISSGMAGCGVLGEVFFYGLEFLSKCRIVVGWEIFSGYNEGSWRWKSVILSSTECAKPWD